MDNWVLALREYLKAIPPVPVLIPNNYVIAQIATGPTSTSSFVFVFCPVGYVTAVNAIRVMEDFNVSFQCAMASLQ